MSDHDDHGFNSTKIFFALFALTAIEVLISFIQVRWFDHPMPKYLYWAVLGVFAFWKGILIYSYFMHMKFEGWIIKCLIAPTPLLILIAVFALMPDVGYNTKLVNPIGFMVQDDTGKAEQMNDEEYPRDHSGDGHH